MVSSVWRAAEVGFVRGVGGGVGEHGVDRGDEGLEAHEAGEDGFVADGIGEDERGALADLVREKFGGDSLEEMQRNFDGYLQQLAKY